MSIHSRLRTFEKSLKCRELALLWLKTTQARGGYLEYWKFGEFQPLGGGRTTISASGHLRDSPLMRPSSAARPGSEWIEQKPLEVALALQHTPDLVRALHLVIFTTSAQRSAF
jgi:hypothetical protein